MTTAADKYVNERLDRVRHLLVDYQIEPFKRILSIIRKDYFYIDSSDGGLGKTALGFILARALGFKVACVTNKGIISKCHKNAKDFGVEIAFFITYESLRGREDRCNHEYLIHNGDKYMVTDKIRQYYNEGIVLILDEFQKAKNPHTLHHKACFALTSALHGTKSCIALLSASPLADEAHMGSIPRLCGIVTEDNLVEFDINTYTHKKKGFAQMELYCRDVDNEKTSTIIPSNVNEKNAYGIYCKLIIEILIPNVLIEMPDMKKYRNVMENRFYTINKDDFRQLNEASRSLTKVYTTSLIKKKSSQAIISEETARYEEISENVKLPLICNKIRELKAIDPNLKFIIFVWRRRSPEIIKNLLPEYAHRIGVLNGTIVDIPERDRIRSKFQEDNDDMPIVVLNPIVAGTGGDWDDTFGNRRRISFLISNPRYIDTYQASKRSSRITSKSNTYTFIVYIKGIRQELDSWKRNNIRVGNMSKLVTKCQFPVDKVEDDVTPFVLPPMEG